MPVTAYVIENLFWDGTTHKVPNQHPLSLATKSKTFSRRPEIIDYLGGSIALEGEDGNYLQYKGNYYFLTKSQVLDIEKNRYLYTLVKDVGVSTILRKHITIRGDLAATRDEDIVRSNLNRVFKIIDNPAKLIRLNFKEEKYDGKKSCTIRPITARLLQRVLSKRDFNNFINATNDVVIKRLDASFEAFYEERKTVFLFGALGGSEYEGGKVKIKTLINEFLKDLSNKHIVKLTKIANSPLVGNYCVSESTGEQIGTPETGYSIENIDLSKLTDIVRVGTQTLTEPTPVTELSEETALFDVPEAQDIYRPHILLKTKAKIYFPYKTLQAPNTPIIKSPTATADSYRQRDQLTPQSIHGKYQEKSGVGLLLGGPQVDFVLTWTETNETIKFSKPNNFGVKAAPFGGPFGFIIATLGSNLDPIQRESMLEHMSEDWARGLFGYYEPIASLFSNVALFLDPNDRMSKATPTVPWEWKYDNIHSPNAMYGKAAPNLGGLMFQLRRTYDEGDLYEYRGHNPTDTVEWYSGLKNNFFSGTSNYPGYHKLLSQPYDSSMRLRGLGYDGNFVAMTLRLDHLLGYALAPNENYSTYGYPYLTQDWYGLNRMNATNQPGNKYISDVAGNARLFGRENPLREKGKFYPSATRERDVQLDMITIRDTMKLPSPMHPGDLLISSLEYDFGEQNGQHFLPSKGLTYPDSEKALGPEIASGHPTQHMKYLGDLYATAGESLYRHIDHWKNKICICKNGSGKFEFRAIEVFSYDHHLSTNNQQIVTHVDKQTHQNITYTKLSKFGIQDVSFTPGEALTTEQRKRILYIYYKSLENHTMEINAGTIGYGPFTASGDGVTDAQINKEFLLFDLVGTKGYAFIAKGKVHLIAKDVSMVSARTDKVNYLDTSKLQEKYDTVDLVNQTNYLNVYTKSYPIVTKFQLAKGDSFNAEVQSITPSQQISNFEHFLVNIKNEGDRIYEYIQVDKKPQSGLQVQDQYTLENLRLMQARNEQDYDFQTYKYRTFAKEKLDTKYTRMKGDLDFQQEEHNMHKKYAGVQYGLNTARNIANLGLAQEQSGTANTMVDIKFAKNKSVEPSDVMMKYSAAHGVAGSLINIAGHIAEGVKMGEEYALRAKQFTERFNRLDVNKEYAFREYAMKVYGVDSNYVRKRQDLVNQINAQTNMYGRGVINDRATLEDLNKRENLREINLSIGLPTTEQKQAILGYVNEFGFDCDIPNTEITLYPGMHEQVVKFRNLNDNSIKGLDSKLERDILIAKLTQGIKIVDIFEKETQLIPQIINERVILQDKLNEANAEIEALKAQLDHDIEIIDDLQVRVSTSEKSVAQCRIELSNMRGQIEYGQNRITEIEQQIAEKTAELNKALDERQDLIDKAKVVSDQLNGLQTRFHQLSEDYRKKEADLAEQIKVSGLYSDEVKELKKEVESWKSNRDKMLSAFKGLFDELATDDEESQKQSFEDRFFKPVDFSKLEGEGKGTQEEMEKKLGTLRGERQKLLDEGKIDAETLEKYRELVNLFIANYRQRKAFHDQLGDAHFREALNEPKTKDGEAFRKSFSDNYIYDLYISAKALEYGIEKHQYPGGTFSKENNAHGTKRLLNQRSYAWFQNGLRGLRNALLVYEKGPLTEETTILDGMKVQTPITEERRQQKGEYAVAEYDRQARELGEKYQRELGN